MDIPILVPLLLAMLAMMLLLLLVPQEKLAMEPEDRPQVEILEAMESLLPVLRGALRRWAAAPCSATSPRTCSTAR